MKIPMRPKYVDEAVRPYMIFGHQIDDPSLVDVHDGTRDIFVGIPRDVAETVVKAHAEFVEKLYGILCKENDGEKTDLST